MKIMVVDDHPLFRDGLVSLLAARGFEVAGQASDGQEALSKARELHPDIILMDIRMPRCSGLEATRLIKAEMPQVKVVILTVSEEEGDVLEAIKSGAHGYLLKNLQSDEFFRLLSGVEKGEVVISPYLAGRILEELAHQDAQTPVSLVLLSDREQGVLRLIAQGAQNKEISQSLGISENTVKFHLRHIMDKLHLRNRAQMAAYAVAKGLAQDKTSR